MPGLSCTLSAVFNGLCRTTADTGHAMGTVLSPFRFSILHLNILQRTDFLAFPVANCQGLFDHFHKEVTFCGPPHEAYA